VKQLATVIVTVLVTIAAILIIWQLRSIVFLFLFSLLIAATVRSPIDYLVRDRWPRWAALTLVYTVLLLGLSGLAVLVSLPLAGESEAIAETIAQQYKVGYGFVQTDRFSDYRIISRLPSADIVTEFLLGDQESELASHVLVLTQTLVSLIGQLFLALILSIYWSADEWHFERLWLSLLPPARRVQMRDLWHRIESRIGSYLRSELTQSILAGALLTAGFGLLSYPYPFTMATIGALAWFIPVVGGLIAVPLIAILIFVHGSWLSVLIAVSVVIAIYTFLEFVVEPRIYDNSGYSMLPVIIVMMVMVEVYGLIGLLIAPPLALAIQITFDEWNNAPEPSPIEETIALQDIADQLLAMQGTIAVHDWSSSYIANMAKRLEALLNETLEAENPAPDRFTPPTV